MVPEMNPTAIWILLLKVKEEIHNNGHAIFS